MARVELATMQNAPVADAAGIAELQAEGAVESRAVLKGDERPIWLWRHQLAPGARLIWERPPTGHLVYVWEGGLTVEDQPLSAGGTFVVEHRANARVTAGASGATLLHFQTVGEKPPANRPGGNIHVVSGEGRIDWAGRSRYVFADANCDTCSLWLHLTNFPTQYHSSSHFHTADEIIVVVRGEMRLGARALTPGGAVAIDKDTQYGFETGPEGVGFINFRPGTSYYVQVGEGGVRTEPRLEQ
jgi:quercetin dioxygenase-like cupin family protein